MTWLLLAATLFVFMFGYVLIFGAPYLPTLKRQQEEALDLLDLKPGQIMLELGSGDGRMLAAAARRGIRSVGYELNPLLFVFSWLATRRYGGLATVKWGNFWNHRLPRCDGVYVFLLDRFMPRLHTKITQEISNPVKVVSLAFKMPDVKHKTEKSGLYLYVFNNK